MVRPKQSVTAPGSLLLPGASLILVVVLGWFGAAIPLDRAWFDFLQRNLARNAPLPSDTALVLIDEQSLEALGKDPYAMRWPWPRGAFAALFAGLHRAGAREIMADLIFLEESDRPEQDQLLGAVAAGCPEVTLGAVPATKTAPEMLPVFWSEAFRREHPDLFARPRWGYVRPIQDSDGVIRRYRLGNSLVEAGGNEAGHAAGRLLRWRGNLETLRARGLALLPAAPFVAAGWSMVDRASEVSPDLDPEEMARAIDAEPAPEGDVFAAVRGKRVFIGANAAATFDYVATPVGAPEPGVIVHWTALASMEKGGFLRDAGPLVELLLLLLVFGAVAITGQKGAGLARPALICAALMVGVVAVSLAAFVTGFWIQPAMPTLGAAVAFTGVAVDRFRLERARKREIQGWFGAYVSPVVVRQLVENPEALRLGGERRDVSVFFSDFAGFTSLSERLPADQLIALTNACLDELSGCIFRHGGYLDKYIGDAIMAVFGSPETLENHALSACRAALECQQKLHELNERFEREFGVRISMRIGINTGDAVMGNVGSERKKNYTALGDTVNLASRLEGANKAFQTPILIGSLTAARVSNEILARPIARLRVKGKARAVEVHEPLAPADSADDVTRRFAVACQEGFKAYCERRFEEAARAFGEAVDLRPGDFAVTRYLAEARRFLTAPPPAEWQPIVTLESK